LVSHLRLSALPAPLSSIPGPAPRPQPRAGKLAAPAPTAPPVPIGGSPIVTPDADPNLLPEHLRGLLTAVVRHMHTALAERRGGRRYITAKDYACAQNLYTSAVVLLSRMSVWPEAHEMGDAAMLVSTAVRLTMRIVHDNQRGAAYPNFFDVCAAAGYRSASKEGYIAVINEYESMLLIGIDHRCHITDADAAAAAACVADWLVTEQLAQRQGARPDANVEDFARRLARPMETALIKPPARGHRHLLKPTLALTALPDKPRPAPVAKDKMTFSYHFKDVDVIEPVPECPTALEQEYLSGAF